MSRLDRTALHQAYKCERHGDALVVQPAGDAVGFALTALQQEIGTILALADEPGIRHLIIDLERANYFGSTVIGDLIRIGQRFKERGGRIALAAASSDMLGVLRIMKLDSLWELFDTVPAALSSMATIPLTERLKPYRRPVAIACVIAAVVAALWMIPRPNYVRIYHEEVAALWQRAKDMQSGQQSVTEWDLFVRKASQRAKEIGRHLERVANPDNPGSQELLWGVTETLPSALHDRCRPGMWSTQMMEYRLALVHWHLTGGQEGPIPQLPAAANGNATPLPAGDRAGGSPDEQKLGLPLQVERGITGEK